jgi:hypothetical protein
MIPSLVLYLRWAACNRIAALLDYPLMAEFKHIGVEYDRLYADPASRGQFEVAMHLFRDLTMFAMFVVQSPSTRRARARYVANRS